MLRVSLTPIPVRPSNLSRAPIADASCGENLLWFESRLPSHASKRCSWPRIVVLQLAPDRGLVTGPGSWSCNGTAEPSAVRRRRHAAASSAASTIESGSRVRSTYHARLHLGADLPIWHGQQIDLKAHEKRKNNTVHVFPHRWL